jgi:hypothetical protein
MRAFKGERAQDPWLFGVQTANRGLWGANIGFQSALRVHFVSPEWKEIRKGTRSEPRSMQVWTWEVPEQTWLAVGTAKIGPCLVIQLQIGAPGVFRVFPVFEVFRVI